MCGIFGRTKNKTQIYSKLSLRYLLNRGPDGIGQYEDKNIILAHSRLAVIDDRATSQQPIINEDFVLICNGEIYNYEEIKKIGGYSYASTSDCEAIIHVYKLFGLNGFCRLDGFYSFALYDKKNKKLILHRDNIGKKPIYFLKNNAEWIFSSNITVIVDNYSGKLNIKLSEIKFYFREGFVNPTTTIFEKIQPILPGELYEIDLEDGKFQKRFLKKFCDSENFDFSDDQRIQTETEKILEKAILKRIKNLEQPVLLFSGGVDSTVLAHFMTRYNFQMNLVSMKQPVRFLNDEPYLRYAAKKMGQKVNFVKIFNKNLGEQIEYSIRNLDQPLSLYSYYFLSALALKAKEFGKVLFTGDGADEVFYGYETPDNWFAKDNVLKPPEISVGPPPKIPLNDWGLGLISTGLLGHAFVKVDKATAENQIEARCPYLDWGLMCLGRGLPRNYWQRHNVSKYPLKKLLTEKGFSEKFVYRKKIGFSYPFRYAMIPQYPCLINYFNCNSSIIKEILGVEPKKPSFVNLFKNFDFYWKLFVLLKYFDNIKGFLKI